jgi:hypothetical protein
VEAGSLRGLRDYQHPIILLFSPCEQIIHHHHSRAGILMVGSKGRNDAHDDIAITEKGADYSLSKILSIIYLIT